MILELKHVRQESEMLPVAKEAGSQLIRQKYGSTLRYEGYAERLQYGMAFWDKRAMIAGI